MPKRIAKFLLSPELLKESLHMPDDTKIISADWDYVSDNLLIYISHPDLREREPGEVPPLIRPIITKHVEPTATTYTWDFNQKEK